MTKLRIALAGVLLSVPAWALNASDALEPIASGETTSLEVGTPVSNWCLIYSGGRFWYVPC